MTKKRKLPAVTRGLGDVFDDLGFAAPEAAELRVKAELTRQIHHRIKRMRLTQSRAAVRLGVSQPDVSKLAAGRFTGFSTDRLMSLLVALDVDIEIVLSPRRNGPGAVHVRGGHAA